MLGFTSLSLAWSTANTGATTAVAGDQLYGLSLVKNPPTRVSLNTVSASTGNVSLLAADPKPGELFGCSDLVAAVPKHGLFYFLGDTSGGATLVALNLTTGAEVCSKVIGLSEVGYVGIGQTLDYDATMDRLLLSGIDATNKTQHVVYGAPADGCGPFTKVGAYGAAGYLPMLHASALDADGQRLFVTVAPGKNTAAIGIIDLTGAAEMAVVAEGTPDPDDVLVGLHFDAKAKKLIGIVAAQALEFHSLDVEAQAWEAPKPLAGVPSTWNAIGGNSAEVSAFSPSSRSLYFLAGTSDQSTGDLSLEVARVDVDTAAVASHVPIQHSGICAGGPSSDCLMALTVVGEA